MSHLGIHIRILFAVVMLVFATTFTMGHMGISIVRGFVKPRFDERIEFLARYLALNSELGILIDERPMLRRFAGNLLSEKDVSRVTIRNRNGEILADEKKTGGEGNSVVDVPVLLKASQEESLAYQWNGVGKETREVIGKVTITYTTDEIDRLLSAIKARLLWLSLGLATLCVIIFYFISRSLVSPVLNLAQAVRKVAEGNLELRVTPSTLPETRQLALAFNAMLDSLESSRKALDEANQEMIRQKTLAEMGKFSMMIAHEVKNPLGIIKSSFDILKKEITGAESVVLVEYIEDEIKRLNRMIEDFLQFARPASPSFRAADLHEMVRGCVMRFDVQNTDDTIKLEIDIPEKPCVAKADPDLLSRAINNLLKNGAEANNKRGRIRVRSYIESGTWFAEIEDEGNGIPESHLSKIFDPFFTTNTKGTGLGLAFSIQAVSAHGGTLEARNIEGGGAKFQMAIPIEDCS